MNCRDCHNNLFEYRDGTLSEKARAAMDAHLASCAKCRAELAEERALAGELKDAFDSATADVSLPPQMTWKVRAALAAESQQAHGKEVKMKGWTRFTLKWGALAGTLAIAVFIIAIIFVGKGGRPPRAQIERL